MPQTKNMEIVKDDNLQHKDPEINRILSDPEISEILKYNRSHRNQIIDAARILKGEDDAIPAARKVIDGIVSNQIKIFFSYKLKEKQAAQKVIEELRTYSAKKIEICYADEFKAGTCWTDSIEKGIQEAHWFILLLPDPAVDWDWCLYESGIFRAKMMSKDRLVCLHHPDIDPPSQLNRFQAVEASEDAVKRFVKELFISKNAIPGMLPINPNADIDKITDTIVEAISPPIEREHFDQFIMIKVDNPDKLIEPVQLNAAKIVLGSRNVPDIFGMQKLPATWGELIEDVTENISNPRWLNELCLTINKAAREKKFDPVMSTFRGYGGKVYRPMLLAVDRTASGRSMAFHITLIEDIGTVNLDHIPAGLRTLAVALRLGYRFRWEVLEHFKNIELTEDNIKALKITLERIESEAMTTDVMDRNILSAQFNRKENAEKIIGMFEFWGGLRNESGTGSLDIALKNNDSKAIRKHLSELAPLNQEFLVMGSKRFSEFMAEFQ